MGGNIVEEEQGFPRLREKAVSEMIAPWEVVLSWRKEALHQLLGSAWTGERWRGMKLDKTPITLVRCRRRDQCLLSQGEPQKVGKSQGRSGFGEAHRWPTGVGTAVCVPRAWDWPRSRLVTHPTWRWGKERTQRWMGQMGWGMSQQMVSVSRSLEDQIDRPHPIDPTQHLDL